MRGISDLPLLRLTLCPGLGPVLIRRCVEAFGGAEGALGASAAALQRVRGIGETKADLIRRGLDASAALAEEELALAEKMGVTLVTMADAEYPPLLRQIEDAPPLLYVRGRLDPESDRHCVAIVGSRACTQYGVEQTERFSAMLSESGLTIVSGGARGIDTAAHRSALRVGGRTIVVMGCGLAHCYPPENAELFGQIAPPARAGERAIEAPGAVISELPLRTAPVADNFPARNRIISGLALGVLVIEAAKGSGALITAKAAAEEQGREVMGVPGRIDSHASEGVNDLIKKGGAALVTCAADVIEILEQPARHLYDGVHEARYARAGGREEGSIFAAPDPESERRGEEMREAKPLALAQLTEPQRRLWDALEAPRSLDEVARTTGVEVGNLLAAATMLEVRRLVVRKGNLLARR